MADWCDNMLIVAPAGDGGVDELQQFAASVVGEVDGTPSPLSFAALLPDPVELDDSIALVEWRAREWGVKWEPDAVQRHATTAGVCYRFLTPYSGPTYWCEYASALYPALSFTLAIAYRDEPRVAVMTFRDGVLMSGRVSEPENGEPLDHWREAADEMLAAVGAADLIPAED